MNVKITVRIYLHHIKTPIHIQDNPWTSQQHRLEWKVGKAIKKMYGGYRAEGIITKMGPLNTIMKRLRDIYKQGDEDVVKGSIIAVGHKIQLLMERSK